jgi:hypothetical protein
METAFILCKPALVITDYFCFVKPFMAQRANGNGAMKQFRYDGPAFPQDNFLPGYNFKPYFGHVPLNGF